jgi:hypothetical protein
VNAILSFSGSVTVKGIGVTASPRQVVLLEGSVVHTGGLLTPFKVSMEVGLAMETEVFNTKMANPIVALLIKESRATLIYFFRSLYYDIINLILFFL